MFKPQQIPAKGILESFNEIFLLNASLVSPQNRSIPPASPEKLGSILHCEPLQEDQSP